MECPSPLIRPRLHVDRQQQAMKIFNIVKSSSTGHLDTIRDIHSSQLEYTHLL